MNEMMAMTLSFGISGVNGFPVQVEVFSAGGLPGIEIIGLPDASVHKSRLHTCDRILRQYRRRKLDLDLREFCRIVP